MANEWLTPLQAAFLTRFFATDTGQLFFLTGGTALSAYHLHHRLSVDLDLFTLDDLALRETNVLIPQLAADLGCRIGRARRTEHFHQFLLTTPPLTLPELQGFIIPLADRLLDRSRPPEN